MKDNGKASEQSSSISIPTLNEALQLSEDSSPLASDSPTPESIQYAATFSRPDEQSLHSGVSSIIPTSARLSIATTHQSANLSSNGANTNHTLDDILNNPGWNVAAQAAAMPRRNSLISTCASQPTLPLYEDHQYHLPLQDEAGPSNPRSRNPVQLEVSNSKTWNDGSYREGHRSPTLSPRTPEDPENALSAHYSGIVRTIDSRYNLELERLRHDITQLKQAHVEEMALMRNKMDAAYRGVLKKREQEVEKAKEEAATLVEKLERDALRWKDERERHLDRVRSEAVEEVKSIMLQANLERESLEEEHRREAERGRHVVEDEWERRWLGRMQLCDEEAARREEKGRKERDEVWVGTLKKRYPHLADEMRELMLQRVHASRDCRDDDNDASAMK